MTRVEVCPVDCFYEGENMLVINPMNVLTAVYVNPNNCGCYCTGQCFALEGEKENGNYTILNMQTNGL